MDTKPSIRDIIAQRLAVDAHQRALKDLQALRERLRDAPSEKIYLWREPLKTAYFEVLRTKPTPEKWV